MEGQVRSALTLLDFPDRSEKTETQRLWETLLSIYKAARADFMWIVTECAKDGSRCADKIEWHGGMEHVRLRSFTQCLGH